MIRTPFCDLMDDRASDRARRHGLGLFARSRGRGVECRRARRHGLPPAGCRRNPRRHRRAARAHQQAVRAQLPAVRRGRGAVRRGARAAPEGDGVRLAAAGAGSEVLCRPRARRRLQGHVHGQRRAGGGEGGARPAPTSSSRRAPKAAAMSAGCEHGAHADGGGRGRADSGADRRRRRRRTRARGRDRARRRRRAARHALSCDAWSRRCTRTSSRRSWIQTATTPRCRKFPTSPPARSGRARCRARGATASSSAGRAASGCCASQQAQALADIQDARKRGDVHEAPLSMGQDAGLINDIPAGRGDRAPHRAGGGADSVEADAKAAEETVGRATALFRAVTTRRTMTPVAAFRNTRA